MVRIRQRKICRKCIQNWTRRGV